MPIYKLFVDGVSILQSSPFESVRVLQQGIFKHILMKYFRQDSEIVSLDLHNNGIFPHNDPGSKRRVSKKRMSKRRAGKREIEQVRRLSKLGD